MERIKEVRSIEVKERSGTMDSVTDKMSNTAAVQLGSGSNVNVSEEKVVPFHAVDTATMTVTRETQILEDPTCVKGCVSMGEPKLTAPTSAVDAVADEEFDPMDGVTAIDDNGKNITGSVEVTVTED